MRSLARLRPSPSMAVALLALFVALGGVGYAAATINSGDIVNNSIKGKDIKNNTVASKDIKDKSVSGKDILTNSVGTEDILANSLNETDIADNSIFTREVGENALTGSDIDESTIGTINFAQNAGNASTVSSVDTIPVTTVLEGGADVILASYGPFVIRGSCTDNAGATRADVTIDSSEDNATYQGEQSSNTNFDAGDTPQPLTSIQDALVAPPTSTAYNEGVFSAFAPTSDTGAITGNIASWAQAAAPSRCKFHGNVVRSG